MPGTSAWTRLDGIRLGWGKPAARRIEAEHEDAIEPLVRNQHEASGGIEYDVVGMRARLLGLVRAGFARQRHELMLILQRPVRRDRQHRDAAAGVIGHDQELAAGVDRLADAVLAARGGPIEQFGLAGGAVEREGGGIIEVAVNRIEKALVRAQGEEGGIDEVADVL